MAKSLGALAALADYGSDSEDSELENEEKNVIYDTLELFISEGILSSIVKESVERASVPSSSKNAKYEFRRNFDIVPKSEQNMNPNEHQEKLLFDSHCHLDRVFSWTFQKPVSDFFKSGSQEPLALLKEKYSINAFKECINVITNVKYFNHKYWSFFFDDPTIWLAIGCHPADCKEYDEQAEYELTKSLEHPKVVALGEIGLDDKWDKIGMPFETQKKVCY